MTEESPDSVMHTASRFAESPKEFNDSSSDDDDGAAHQRSTNATSTTVSLIGRSLRNLADLHSVMPDTVQRQGFQSVCEINLYNNELTSIAALRPLVALEVLNVSANNLHEFDIATLRSFKRLRILDVGSNCLTNVAGIHELTTLDTLDVSYNNIALLSSFSNDGTTLTSILRRRNLNDGAGRATQAADLEVVHRHKAEDVPSSPSMFRHHSLQRLFLHGNCIDDIEELSHLTGYPQLKRLTVFSTPIYGCNQNRAAVDAAYKAAVAMLLPNLQMLDGKPFDHTKEIEAFKIAQRTNPHPLERQDAATSANTSTVDRNRAVDEFEPLQAIKEQLQDIQRLKLDMQEIRLDSLEKRIGIASEPRRHRERDSMESVSTDPDAAFGSRSQNGGGDATKPGERGSSSNSAPVTSSQNPWDRPRRYRNLSNRSNGTVQSAATSNKHREHASSDMSVPTMQTLPRTVRTYHEAGTQTKKVISPEDVHRSHQLVALRMHLSTQRAESEETASFVAALARSLGKVEVYFRSLHADVEQQLEQLQASQQTKAPDISKDEKGTDGQSGDGSKPFLPFFANDGSRIQAKSHSTAVNQPQRPSRSLSKTLPPEYHALSFQTQTAVEIATAVVKKYSDLVKVEDAKRRELQSEVSSRDEQLRQRSSTISATKEEMDKLRQAAEHQAEESKRYRGELDNLRREIESEDLEGVVESLRRQLDLQREEHRNEVEALAHNNELVMEAMATKLEQSEDNLSRKHDDAMQQYKETTDVEMRRLQNLAASLETEVRDAKLKLEASENRAATSEKENGELRGNIETVNESLAEWQTTAKRRGDNADRAERLLKQALADAATLRDEMASQHQQFSQELAQEKRSMQQFFEGKLEAQQVLELAQATAAQQALRGAETVQKQLSERAAALEAEAAHARQQLLAAESDASRQIVRLQEALFSKEERLTEAKCRLQEVAAREQHALSLNSRLASMVKAQKDLARRAAEKAAADRREITELRKEQAERDVLVTKLRTTQQQLEKENKTLQSRLQEERAISQSERAKTAKLTVELEDAISQNDASLDECRRDANSKATEISAKLSSLLEKYRENQLLLQAAQEQLDTELQTKKAQDLILKDSQDSAMAIKAQLRDARDQLKRALERKEELKAECGNLRRQVALQTELAEEYRGIARDLQDRQVELQEQNEELAASSLSPEQHTSEIESYQRLVDEKQKALEIASQEVGQLEQAWRSKIDVLEQQLDAEKKATQAALRDVAAEKSNAAAVVLEKSAIEQRLAKSNQLLEEQKRAMAQVESKLQQLEHEKAVMTQKIKKMSSLFNSFVE